MLRNINLVNAQTEVNRAVWASNLAQKDFEGLAKVGSSVTNEKSALEHMIAHAERAIQDLNHFLNETK